MYAFSTRRSMGERLKINDAAYKALCVTCTLSRIRIRIVISCLCRLGGKFITIEIKKVKIQVSINIRLPKYRSTFYKRDITKRIKLNFNEED